MAAWDYLHSAVPVGIEKAPDGVLSFRSEIQDGKLIYDTERSEWANGPGDSTRYRGKQGDETWTRLSVYLAADFPKYASWSLIEQWKVPHAGTPPQQISLTNERFSIATVGSDRRYLPIGAIARGRRVEFVVGHLWHSEGGMGWVEVWRDGMQVLTRTTLKTLEKADDQVFWSIGQYRDKSNTGTSVAWHGRVTVGRTRAAVMG